MHQENPCSGYNSWKKIPKDKEKWKLEVKEQTWTLRVCSLQQPHSFGKMLPDFLAREGIQNPELSVLFSFPLPPKPPDRSDRTPEELSVLLGDFHVQVEMNPRILAKNKHMERLGLGMKTYERTPALLQTLPQKLQDTGRKGIKTPTPALTLAFIS